MMGWSLGFDEHWQRDIGYGVPAYCDHPRCSERIDRGLSYVCGGDPCGGDHGCGLYFCAKHLTYATEECFQLCYRCGNRKPPYKRPKPDHPEWIQFKMTDESWAEWRKEQASK